MILYIFAYYGYNFMFSTISLKEDNLCDFLFAFLCEEYHSKKSGAGGGAYS